MFNPDWDIVYLMHRNIWNYCVIKKPEPIPGEKTLMVREGCTVHEDGRWYYWRLPKPMDYEKWKKYGPWDDSRSDNKVNSEYGPNYVVSHRLNKGKMGVVPAPKFKARSDNNWIGGDPMTIPMHLTEEMLGDLTVAHLQLCDELQEGKVNETANK